MLITVQNLQVIEIILLWGSNLYFFCINSFTFSFNSHLYISKHFRNTTYRASLFSQKAALRLRKWRSVEIKGEAEVFVCATGWVLLRKSHPHSVTSQGQLPNGSRPLNPLQWQKMHFPDDAQNICMLPVKGEQIHPACQTVNRLQKIAIIYWVALGLRKQPGRRRHWILFKKTYFTYCFFIIQAVLQESLLLFAPLFFFSLFLHTWQCGVRIWWIASVCTRGTDFSFGC